jgi:hypothetical protein
MCFSNQAKKEGTILSNDAFGYTTGVVGLLGFGGGEILYHVPNLC